MDFAGKQLEKHGWKKGQGLGKAENGIKEAVKVKVKQDKVGVGHDPGEEFSFHWWDHVFNKAASKIQVNTTEDGVEIKNNGETKVSKKKNSKTFDNKAMLYGQFVKGSTLSGGVETRDIANDSGSDDDDDEKAKEAAQCLMPSQEEVVFQKCGGRTAHKGARHGLKLNGKLQRIQEQEKLLLESYKINSSKQIIKEIKLKCNDTSVKSDRDVFCQKEDKLLIMTEKQHDLCSELSTEADSCRKPSKKKKKKKNRVQDFEKADELQLGENVLAEENREQEVKLEDNSEAKKRRTNDPEGVSESSDRCNETGLDEKQKVKKKKKSKKKKYSDIVT